ncbi:MauE/DoxX family redox-associated membrane protein [Nonomuraea fuscirosea]|uniref:MauE/DoxX family redox-associated membrane protein n=1 Tax=Nonomuraea fuscirosea TaxID=1291556 RepID=UPI0034321D2B
MNGIAASQPYVIAFFLLWAGLMKLLSRRMRAQAGQTALARLTGPARAVPVLRLVGLAEVAVAAALLLPAHLFGGAAGALLPPTPVVGGTTAALSPPAHLVGGVAAALLSAGFLGYLAYAHVAAPTASCGCLGTHAKPVDARSFARAGLLLAAALVTVLLAAAPGLVPAVTLPGGLPEVVVLAEIAALLALSSELDRYWLVPLRRLLVRLRRPLALAPTGSVPLEASLHLLRRSPAYCSASAQLTSDVRDTWDEDGVRFVVYGARDRTAVFAVPLVGDDPRTVKVALVSA